MNKQASKIQSRFAWPILTAGATIGLVASFIQTIEKINYSANPTVALSCDLNSVFSCSNVFDAWQSSVFGFSNSLLCVAFFAVMLGVALVGLTGSSVNRILRLVMQFFSLFFLGFGAWYLWQSTFNIGYICIFCSLCYSGVIAMNWAWLRLNYRDIPLSTSMRTSLARFIAKGGDTFLWILWGILIATMITLHFW